MCVDIVPQRKHSNCPTEEFVATHPSRLPDLFLYYLFCSVFAGLRQEGPPSVPGPAQGLLPRGRFFLPLFGWPCSPGDMFWVSSRDSLCHNRCYMNKIQLNWIEIFYNEKNIIQRPLPISVVDIMTNPSVSLQWSIATQNPLDLIR